MYALKPPYVLVLEEVLDDPLMRARAERMLSALPAGTPVETVSLERLPEATIERNWAGARRRMTTNPPGEPALFLGAMRFDGKWPETQQMLAEHYPQAGGPLRAAYGYDAFVWFDSGMHDIAPCADHICRPAWRIHLTNGCPHKCFYCGLTGVITVMMNVEQYVEHLHELAMANPWEKTFLFEDDSEALVLEPQYGAVRALAEYFATTEDRYLLIHSKSANVDFLEDIGRAARERTIIVWSLTGRTQSEQLEPLSATMEQRIEAAAKCHEMGITTRFKYKPIVPVVGWRGDIAEMTRLVFERTRPDLIALFALAWMTYDELVASCEPERLDPVYLRAARDGVDELRDLKVKPFPHWVRREIYEFCIEQIRRYDADIPIVLCTESAQMWEELGESVGYRPADYPCGCGPQATPRLRRLPESPWVSTKPVGVEGYPLPY